MRTLIAAWLLLFASLPALSQAPTTPEDPAHNELRALRDGLLAAIKKGDIERQLTYLHPNVVITWQNAEVSRGREGVRKYLNRMLVGPPKIVESYNIDLNVDELSILYGGDTAIAFGNSKDQIKLTDGTDVELDGARWSTTMVKEGGQWLIANAHASSNLFNNPLLNVAKKMLYVAGAIALVVGLGLGFFLGRRRKPAA